MAVESKPLFHPEVMRQQVRSFNLPERVAGWQPKLQHWATLIASGRADEFKETELLPDFLTDIFCGLLGYTGPAGKAGAYTLSRERHVEVDGEFADAVLGLFQKDKDRFTAVLEGKGTRDPLERPFAGRRMSAVDQAYRYAINLPCDWIIVTSMRETRLYYKGAHQQTYERFETVRLAADEALLKRFVFLLGAERVVPVHRECHLYDLLRASETVGRELTNQFYALYADIRQRVLTRLCRENAAVAPTEILRCTQKLLDRILFCAFCEDRGLLPAESLKKAFEHRDPYNPHPVWHNFRGLFRAIDEGNAGLNIPAYNGGLFALDPALDALQVSDEVCAHFKELGDYDYRPAREVADAAEDTTARSVIDVDILGHIFEQSITDLERLRGNLERTPPNVGQCVSPAPSAAAIPPKGAGETRCPTLPGRRRKQEGAVYTPAFITRYLVEQALGGVLKQRFETLRRQHEAEPKTARLCTIPREQLRIDDLSVQIEREGSEMDISQLDAQSWRLEPKAVDSLLTRIREGRRTLKEVTGIAPLYGIKTGLNEAFLIDDDCKRKLIAEHEACEELIKPYVRGADLGRWSSDWANLWMIVLPSSSDRPWPWADLGDGAEAEVESRYPSLHRHLKPLEEALRKRQDKGRYWWELRPCAYWDAFEKPKIFYQEIQFHPAYSLDSGPSNRSISAISSGLAGSSRSIASISCLKGSSGIACTTSGCCRNQSRVSSSINMVLLHQVAPELSSLQRRI